MEQIPVKHTVLFLVMFVTSTHCIIRTITVIEGDIAFLNFTYSCSSTKVTLQRGSVHIYNSKSLISRTSSNLKFRNETDGKVCFLYLTIDPVTRVDQGGYKLFAYMNGYTQFEEDEIQLWVNNPPGKASCSLSEEHIDRDWVRLQCTAPLGNIRGFIMCYQNGIKIPPLNPPQEHDEILSQTLLAKVGNLVYCCSSTLDQTKDRCECKDSVWDPIQNKQVTIVTDPCPPAVPIQFLTFSRSPTEDNEFEVTSPSTEAPSVISYQLNSNKATHGLIVVVCFLILVYIVSIAGAFYYFKRHPNKLENCKTLNEEQKSFTAESKV